MTWFESGFPCCRAERAAAEERHEARDEVEAALKAVERCGGVGLARLLLALRYTVVQPEILDTTLTAMLIQPTLLLSSRGHATHLPVLLLAAAAAYESA